MYVCMYVCVYVRMYARFHKHDCMYDYIYICIFTYIYAQAESIRIYVYEYVCMYECMYVPCTMLSMLYALNKHSFLPIIFFFQVCILVNLVNTVWGIVSFISFSDTATYIIVCISGHLLFLVSER